MLAYVFWHWRRPDVDPASYAGRLAAFHQALRRAAPEGFVSSTVFRAGSAPWVAAEESYEDWYLTHGSYALDPLNDGVVAGDCGAPHDDVARDALGGTGGLYRLRIGHEEIREATWANWFHKPAGMSYARLFEEMEPLATAPGASLWGRQMTLGPTPEFCLLSPAPLALQSGYDGLQRPLERLWPTTLRGLPQESMDLG
ncbi:MAG: hypothetical protein E6K80_15220 [Candidatus Eisenbacteria bacterium]|uniref:Uncharacterized protein n=1 Tax=Eiseniibacteriota bacterium TaxID=2212470 RepID=A0A538TV13_UNCEI|nr:MAG: hypothetical protein E6K80_15220 [Candidatus Eisenbacteria bacterium]